VPQVSTLCEKAAQELNVIMPGENLSDNDGKWLLGKLNQLFGEWNTKREAIYRSVPTTHTLVPSLNPHTFGPSGATFTVAQRPVMIDAINLILSGNVSTPIDLHDVEWYRNLPMPSITSTIPTDGYYDPAHPNGALYLYPVPTSAYQIEVWTRLSFAVVALTDTVTFPQGYEGAIIDTLAEDSAEGLGREPGRKLVERARRRRADLYALNDPTPHLVTIDGGMPGYSRHGRGSYLTGWQ
jgi:hypothetical protein